VKVWGRINGMFIKLKDSHPISRSSLNLDIWDAGLLDSDQSFWG
jgi:hypothetical protein